MKLNIGDNIRKFRKEANMTQGELADRLGTTDQSVSRWENGSTYPDMELLPVLAELFGVTTDALLGIPEIEKEKKATDVIDLLSREAMKSEIDPAKVIPLIRDIRNNYLGCSCAWRLWVQSNYRCYRHPEILPEVRLMADAYRDKTSFTERPFWIQAMALVESEENINDFLNKYSNELDTSERALRFLRYYELRNSEMFEPERRFRFYLAIDMLLNPRTLIGWSDEPEDLIRVASFQAGLLNFIRDDPKDNTLDMWVLKRITLVFNNAVFHAKTGDGDGAIASIEKGVCLLEKVMDIKDKRILGCSCSWLDGMECEVSEDWTDKRINPDKDEERVIRLEIRIGQLHMCSVILPSYWYNMLVGIADCDVLRDKPQFKLFVDRVKSLIVTKSMRQ
jgi:Predicted transcriptional regulators